MRNGIPLQRSEASDEYDITIGIQAFRKNNVDDLSMQISPAWKFWGRDRIPIPAQHWEREHYIPIKPSELVERLVHLRPEDNASDPASSGATYNSDLNGKWTRIAQWAHEHYRSAREEMLGLYDAFDPDADARMVPSLGAPLDNDRRNVLCRTLVDSIADSLEAANYRRLKPKEIQEALEVASHWGVRLRIRFASFRNLEVYARGDIVAKRVRRDWRIGFRYGEFDVPIYQRLVVVFRTKELQNLPDVLDPNCVHLRIFKNIPKADVDMMLPGSQIRLNWTDTGKIGIPTAWGLVMLASKLVKSFWLVTLLGAFKFFSSFVFIIAIAVASLVYGVKTVFSYSTTKRKYQLNIATNLYYQNLDNNLGALLRLLEEAEQQEVCEALVAYYVLNGSSNSPMHATEVDLAAEAILKKITGLEIDFDVEDALRDLASIGIATFTESGWTTIDEGNKI